MIMDTNTVAQIDIPTTNFELHLVRCQHMSRSSSCEKRSKAASADKMAECRDIQYPDRSTQSSLHYQWAPSSYSTQHEMSHADGASINYSLYTTSAHRILGQTNDEDLYSTDFALAQRLQAEESNKVIGDIDHSLAKQLQLEESDTTHTKLIGLLHDEEEKYSSYSRDLELAQILQEEETKVANPDINQDIELARKLQEEENNRKMPQSLNQSIARDEATGTQLLGKTAVHQLSSSTDMDTEMAHRLQEQEIRQTALEDIKNDSAIAYSWQDNHNALIIDDMAMARRLQEEENSYNMQADLRTASDVNFAQRLQEEENSRSLQPDPCTVGDIELARTLQEEEDKMSRTLNIDLNLAQQLQQEESSTSQTAYTRSELLQGEEFQRDLEMARQLQEENAHVQKDSVKARFSFSDGFTTKVLSVASKYQVRCDIENDATGNQTLVKMEGVKSDIQAAVRGVQQLIIDHHEADTTTVEWDGLTQVPAEWQEQSGTVEVFPVTQGSAEWLMVEQKFSATVTRQIVSISRIQNKWLWKYYSIHKKKLHIKNNGNVNELELFHGTRTNNPKLIYEGENGFDMRYSNKGMWGTANYFAAKASYSDRYAFTTNEGCREIFLVKVLTGDSYGCAPDRSLRKPPAKSNSSVAGQLQMDYDSVSGETEGSQVFMTYDNDKAYPAYIIKYQ